MSLLSTDKNEYLMQYQNDIAVKHNMQSVTESAISNHSIDIYSSILNKSINLISCDNCSSTISNVITTADGDLIEPKEYIFDRKEVRILFITLYTLVFCCCFFGKFTHDLRKIPFS